MSVGAKAGLLVALAVAGHGLGGCRRSAMPPRADGAAVVVSAEMAVAESDVKPVPETEPNDTLAAAQRLPIGVAAPAAVAGSVRPIAGGKRDSDLYRLDIPPPDGGGMPLARADAAFGQPAPARRNLRADVRPETSLAVTLEALDDTGKVLISAGGAQAAEVISIPNLAVTPGTYYVRVRGGESSAGGYRLILRMAPVEPGAEIEPNGSAALATELAPGGEAVGYLGWRRDQDWYRLPTAGLPEGSVLSVDLDPVPGVSASLMLADAVERKLSEARGRKAERVALRSLRVPTGDAQVYVVVRADAGSNANIRYNLRPRAELPKPGGEAEPNDDAAHAQAIADGTVLGYLSRGDVDLYRYATGGPAELDVEVVPPERVDVKLEVQREDGTRIARADAGRRREAERIPNLYVPGTNVLIRLAAGSGDGNPDEPYRLTVSSRAPEAGAEREPNDTIATPTALAPEQGGFGLVAPRGDVDFWKIGATPDAEGAVPLTVAGIVGLTLTVRVLGESGRELARAKVPNQTPITLRVVPDGDGCCLVEIRETSGKLSNPRDRYAVTVTQARDPGRVPPPPR